MIRRHRRFQRCCLVLAPIGDQLVETDRVHHGARENMGTDFRALLDHDDGKIGIDLFEPDRRRQAGRPAPDNHHIIIHALAGHRQRVIQLHSGSPVPIPSFCACEAPRQALRFGTGCMAGVPLGGNIL